MILSPSGLFKPCAFDYAGDIRWHLDALCVFDYKRLKNGNLLICTDRLLKLMYYMSGLYEMSPVGKIYKDVEVKELTLDHVKAFDKELKDAGINSDKLSPQLLPNYTKQANI